MRLQEVAEIARIDDYLDMRIVPGDATQNIHGAICRIVINYDVLVAIIAAAPRRSLGHVQSGFRHCPLRCSRD